MKKKAKIAAGSPQSINCRGKTYEIHKAANVFPMFLEGALNELADDILKHGLAKPIARDQNGAILDGRNRLVACDKARVEPDFTDYELSHDEAVAFVISKNVRRRHLKAADKRKAISALLKLKPDASNRQIGKETGSSHVTVAAVREEEEACGQIVHIKHPKARKTPNKPKTIGLREAALRARRKADVAVDLSDPDHSPKDRARDASGTGLANFRVACNVWIPKITEADDQQEARDYFEKAMAKVARLNGSAATEISEDERRAPALAEKEAVH